MIDERYTELMHAEIDGELSDAERAELDGYLDGSTEARAFRAELHEFAAVMDRVPAANPPGSLGQNVLDRIELPVRRISFLRGLALTPAAIPHYAIGLLAGVALATGVYTLVAGQTTSEDVQNLVGTMIQDESLPETVHEDQMSLELEAVHGEVVLQRGEGTFILEFDLDSLVPVEVVMNFARDGLRFGGFAQTHDELGVVEIGGGTLRVVNEGRNRFAVFLRSADEMPVNGEVRIELGFFAGGQRVHEGELATRR